MLALAGSNTRVSECSASAERRRSSEERSRGLLPALPNKLFGECINLVFT